MDKPCILLDETRYDTPVCKAGVNFYSVGVDRALCQVCPLLLPDRYSLCPYTEVYTWLRQEKEGPRIVAEIVCTLGEHDTSLAAPCAGCPGSAIVPVTSPVALPRP